MTEPHAASHASPHTAPGRMTAVMRALRADASPRVLRVGIVRGGRVVEERVLKLAQSITMGREEGCTFVVGDGPACAIVLEHVGGAYRLDARAASAGRVALVDGVHEVAALRARGKVALDDHSRGRVVVGDTTLLFQFVAAPPPALRPQLPLSVRSGTGLDWLLTMIAGVSFLLHFGLVGAMYSDWTDPIVDEQVAVNGVISEMRTLPNMEPDLVADSPPTPPLTPTPASPRPRAPALHPAPSPEPRAPAPAPSPSPHVTDADASRLAAAAKKIRMDVLASTSGTTALDAALRRTNVPVVDLTDAAKANATIAHADTDLGRAGAPIRPGPASHDLSDVVGRTATTDGDAKKQLADAKPPPIAIDVSKPDMTSPVPHVEATIASLRAQLRGCYDRGLAIDPTMRGSVVLRTKIGPNGQVVRVDATNAIGLSDAVTQCLARAVKGADFDPPGGSGSTVDVPVKLVTQ